MLPSLWEKVEYFNYAEEWGNPYVMWVHLIYYLDEFRRDLESPLHIHCGWEERDTGWHPRGAAADLHSNVFHYKELAFRAMRFPFTGIGLYPFWNNKGLHLDVRPRPKDSKIKMWWRDKKGVYHNIESLSTLMELPD
jgi:hypothetical protein